MKYIYIVILMTSANYLFANKWGLGNVYPLELKNSLYGYENIENNMDTIILKYSNVLVDWSNYQKSKFGREFSTDSLRHWIFDEFNTKVIKTLPHANCNIDDSYSFVINNYLLTVQNQNFPYGVKIKTFSCNGNITDSIWGLKYYLIGWNNESLFFRLRFRDTLNSNRQFIHLDFEFKDGKISKLNQEYFNKLTYCGTSKNMSTDVNHIHYFDGKFLVKGNNIYFTNQFVAKPLIVPNLNGNYGEEYYSYNNQIFFTTRQESFGEYYNSFISKIDTLGNLECIYDTETLNVGNVFINEFVIYKKYLIISATFYSKSPVLNHMEPEDYPNTIFIYDYVNKKYLDKPFRIEYDKPIE